MNFHLIASPQLTERQDLVRRIGLILLGLAAVVARRFLREPRLMRFTVLLWQKLSRAVGRIERAVGRPARVQVKRLAPQMRRKSRVQADAVRLPGRRNWLVAELGYEAVGYGLQLQHVLDQPAMQAMVAQVPAVARILRPICRMLGIAIAAPATPEVPATEPATTSPAPAAWPLAGDGMALGRAEMCPDFASGG